LIIFVGFFFWLLNLSAKVGKDVHPPDLLIVLNCGLEIKREEKERKKRNWKKKERREREEKERFYSFFPLNQLNKFNRGLGGVAPSANKNGTNENPVLLHRLRARYLRLCREVLCKLPQCGAQN
jgi:hypothetical protein